MQCHNKLQDQPYIHNNLYLAKCQHHWSRDGVTVMCPPHKLAMCPLRQHLIEKFCQIPIEKYGPQWNKSLEHHVIEFNFQWTNHKSSPKFSSHWWIYHVHHLTIKIPGKYVTLKRRITKLCMEYILNLLLPFTFSMWTAPYAWNAQWLLHNVT